MANPSAPAPRAEEIESALARQQERFEAILAIGRAIGSTLDLDHVLRLVIDHTTRLVQAERSTLFLVDPERQELWSKVVQGEGIREIRLPWDRGVAGWVRAHDEPVIINDAAADARFNPGVDKETGFTTRSMLVVPLHDMSGGVLGAIQALNRKSGGFGPDDLALLQAIASQAGVAIENARLYRDAIARNKELLKAKEALAASVAELDLLYGIEQQISAAATLEDLLDKILAQTLHAIGVEAGSILLREDESGRLYFKSAAGEKRDTLKTLRLDPGQGIAGRVAASGEPILTNDAVSHPAFERALSEQIGFPIRSVLCVPLIADARVIGALELINTRDGEFTEHTLRIATLLAGQLARAIVLGRSREEGERKARLAAIGTIVSGMLHDLRTPMTIISGYAELLAGEDEEAEREKHSAVILKQLDHINAMARETLAFAKGERDILLRKVHLNQLMEEVGGYLHKEFEGKGIELQIEARYNGAARLDEGKLKRAIYNLARNAAQAMPRGGRFTIRVDKRDSEVQFEFEDTGVGIPQEIAGRVFESFVTAGKKDGTGLGLAMVKKIVDDHGGRISFQSKPGVGTCFTLNLPAQLA